MHVERERYRCITQLIDTILRVQASRHPDLVHVLAERANVGQDVGDQLAERGRTVAPRECRIQGSQYSRGGEMRFVSIRRCCRLLGTTVPSSGSIT
jgi:hypothetical protein